ncbi:MAG: GAF domain-containing protein [Spirochaetales bacterium]|nr:GAF domain-containing protein [Spirochaetales bacterium]
MTRLVLYKAPDVPEILPDSAIQEYFEIRLLDPVSGSSDRELSAFSGYLCGWFFFREQRELFRKLKVVEGSVLIIVDDNCPTEILNDPLVFNSLCGDDPDILLRSVKCLEKTLRLQREYLKANNLNNELLSIGIALSAERDNNKLLNDILYKIRQITRADAGSLYLIEKIDGTGEQNLLFKIAHNDSNPSDFTEFRMSLNTKSIAGYVAVTSKILNIPDVYQIAESEPYNFNKSYDVATEYSSRSMLTVPMVDHLENIIGVIQLINRKKSFSTILETMEDVVKYVEPFDREDENIVLSLASQAAVSLENNILYNEIETLFEGFVAASVKAIESRDPTTSGHSSRVAGYSVAVARAINDKNDGPFGGIMFTDDQLKEFRYAGLLHDFGKVGVREAVLVKAKKLYPGQLELLKMRFAYIRKCAELEYALNQDEQKYQDEIREIDEALSIISASDEPSMNIENPASSLEEYHGRIYTAPDGSIGTWLTDYELELLSINKGSLTASEREEIESHVVHSQDFLQNIPWTSSLKGLPGIARGHHERLDGTGYPDGIGARDLSLQSRIMAVADIYDALTANDRPYKKALSSDIALEIIREEAEANHLDGDIVDIFIKSRIYETGTENQEI